MARDGDLLLLPVRGATAALLRHLRGQIFFMDKVRITDLSPQFARLRIMGAQAGRVLAAAGCDGAALAGEAWREDAGVIALAQAGFDVPGFELLVPVDRLDAFTSALRGAGAVQLGDDVSYTARRVELGRPAAGAELTDEYNPLEAGLAWACADNKGCYTGQEIIARQVTYDKVTRTLVGLRSTTLLAPGTAVSAEGREVGVVTSAALSPALNAPLALAIVRRPHNATGTALSAGNQPAQVVDLPFVA